ncbi:putative lipid II flippase FtsW [Fusibacter ferrireducens]|uniref:Probable peptidoglycan glycosyltransferase FtsW n=1 Tax=Fusibacter ferrireducens TaxID=2785058 RepID=A0ABR9ZME6_9FIRM|nr:putative lipid II flippase FtsW [Fusibacter ferrireducens]MBF4691604.1 putative lipid II flippase FtsW [Fusibacter ferrireducens]
MKTNRIDYTLLIVTLLLAAFGLLMVFSSSYYYAIEKMQNKTHFFLADIRWVSVGVVVMLVASQVNYKSYKKLAIPALIVSLVLLVYVLLFGTEINHAKRWIYIGEQSFMPAEIAKIGLILFFSYSLEKNYTRLNELPVLGTYVGIIGICGFLVMKQPNMSTAVIIAGILCIMLFVAGLYWRYTLTVLLGGSAIAWALVKSAPYRMRRWTSFMDPFHDPTDDSYQVVQSLYALGTGGVRGVGLGMSTQNKLYIPEPQNDFILATIGEELGFIGTVLLLVFFLILIYRCVKIAMNAPDRFSFFMATGITAMLTLQVIMNYAVATSSMPATGISLPFISMGGTSLVILMGSVGILLNISKHCSNRG